MKHFINPDKRDITHDKTVTVLILDTLQPPYKEAVVYLDTLTPDHVYKSMFVPIDVSKTLMNEWQTVLTQIRCHILGHLIWVYTVCSCLSVPVLRIITVYR